MAKRKSKKAVIKGAAKTVDLGSPLTKQEKTAVWVVIAISAAIILLAVFSVPRWAHAHDSKPTPTPPPIVAPPPSSTQSTDQAYDWHDTHRAVRNVLLGALVVCGIEYVYVGTTTDKWQRLCFTGYGDKPKDENPGVIVPPEANDRSTLYGVEITQTPRKKEK